MSPDLSPEAWAQIRHDYEHTERPINDICAEHGISSGTLRDRMRRWRWTRRRVPIPLDGPPAVPGPFPDIAASVRAAASRLDGTERNPERLSEPLSPPGFASLDPGAAHSLPALSAVDASTPAEHDDRPITERLQSAVDRVLPAIEATLARLGTQGMQPREMERAARALASLTRTLRELSGLLGQRRAEEPPEHVDVLRARLAQKLEAFVASRAAEKAARGEFPIAPSPVAGERTIDTGAPEPRIRLTDCP